MIELPLYNQQGQAIDKININESLFGSEINKKLLRDVIIMYEASQRRGTASTKRRSEVSGSSRKPWRQKGTGRARVGTVRSPIWRHGGIVFGPHPRDYSYRLPKRMLRKALDSALLSKFQDKETTVVESIKMEQPKTKEIMMLLKNIGIKRSCLIGIKNHNRTLHLSARNIPATLLLAVEDFNAYAVLKYKNLILTKEALEDLISRRKTDKETIGLRK